MVELVLSASLALVTVAVLIYLFQKEDRSRKFYLGLAKETSEATHKNFNAYLKHIQNLEKIVIENKKPRPVDEDHVREILAREKYTVVENDIDKPEEDQGVKLDENNFASVIPFSKGVNIEIEQDMPLTAE